jgi:Lon protease-like protein
LPDTVLFPGTAVPLEITGRSDLALLGDALAFNGRLVVVLARAHIQSHVGCLAQIVHYRALAAGGCEVVLHGLGRVALRRELPRRRAYRQFEVEVMQEDAQAQPESWSRFHSLLLNIRRHLVGHDPQLGAILDSTSDPLALADVLAAVLVEEPDVRQALLDEPTVDRRLEHLSAVMVARMADGRRSIVH